MTNVIYGVIGGLVLLAGSYLFGYKAGQGNIETIVKEVVVEKQGETKTVFRDRVVTVTKEVKPDGTVTETTTTKDSDKTVDKKTNSTKKDTDSETRPTLSQYKLGISAVSSWESVREIAPTYELSAGARIGTLPIFLRGGIAPRLHQVSLGIEVEL